MQEQTAKRPPRLVLRVAMMGVLFVACAAASYGLTSVLRASPAPPARTASARPATPPPPPFDSGRYLLAFVFVSSECGFSTLQQTRRALRAFPDSLRKAHGAEFTKVSVIGVSIDKDVEAGIRFLRDVDRSGKVFDEISVGRSWMNEQVLRLVWREGMATPNLPQVVLVERTVDVAQYPRHLGTGRDNVLLNVTGSNDIVEWVGKGAKLRFTPTSARNGAS